VVAHEQLRSDEEESSRVSAKPVSPSVAPVGVGGKTQGVNYYIVPAV